MKFNTTTFFIVIFIILSFLLLSYNKNETIKIGLLYSKTGTTSIEESQIAKIVHFAIKEINDKGGILNKKIEIIEYDGKSDPNEFKKGANYLVDKKISAMFGCWTSASRKAVKPIIEKNNILLIYPVQYEGFEESQNIIYLGSVPNQQINPTIHYILNNIGKDIYIVGSDYIYPRMAHMYLEELSYLVGFNILGSSYAPLGETNFNDIALNIQKLKPKAIINTLNGDSNVAFFKALKQYNITPQETPVFSFSLDESGVDNITKKIGRDSLNGNYITGSYFTSIESKQNKIMLKKLKDFFGADFKLTDSSYLSYLGIQLWYQAAIKSGGNLDTWTILANIKKDTINSIFGIVKVTNNNHLSKNISIIKLNKNGDEIVWKSEYSINPIVFPAFQNKDYWLAIQEQLFKSWDNQWQYQNLKGE